MSFAVTFICGTFSLLVLHGLLGLGLNIFFLFSSVEAQKFDGVAGLLGMTVQAE